MRNRLCILSLALLAACGGGEPANQPATNASTEPDLSEEEFFAQERMKNLKRIANEAVQKYPELGEYDKMVARAKAKLDGRDAFLAAAMRSAELSWDAGDEPWRSLLMHGEQVYEANFDEKPTAVLRQEALSRSASVAAAMDELRFYDSLFVFSSIGKEHERIKHILTFFMAAGGRLPLLLATEKHTAAARELANLFEVVARLDWQVNTSAQLWKRSLAGTYLSNLAAGGLAPLQHDAVVVSAVEQLREDTARGFKRRWWVELADAVCAVKKAEKPDDIWPKETSFFAPPAPSTGAYEWIDFRLRVADEFPEHAPDPFDPDQYNRVLKIAGEAGGRSLAEDFAWLVRSTLEAQQVWLAWDLCQADHKEPLIDNREMAEKLIRAVPYMTAEWSEAEIKLSIAKDCPYLADSGNLFTRTITVKLRPSAK